MPPSNPHRPATCPRCGYAKSASGPCPTCEAPGAPAIRPLPSVPARGPAALIAGALAFPRGLALLFTSRGVKRLMLPPFLITLLLFSAVIWIAERGLTAGLDRALAAGQDARIHLNSLDTGWWRNTLEWLLNEAFGAEILRGSSSILFVVLAILVSWFTFSLAFELIAGPFLDEIHGLLEGRWFGRDPRKERHRPTQLAVRVCIRNSWILGLIGAGLFTLGFMQLHGWATLLSIGLFALPFLVASNPGGMPGLPHAAEYSKWLRWVLLDNTRALGASATVAALTLLLMILALPLHFIPVIGSVLYSGIVGFATALGMLDLAIERRDLRVKERLGFAMHYALPVSAFGVITGFVFAVPVIGPMLAVPSASIGGLWLVCRLDKRFLTR